MVKKVFLYSLSILILVIFCNCSKEKKSTTLFSEYQNIIKKFDSKLKTVRSRRTYINTLNNKNIELKQLLKKIKKLPTSDDRLLLQGKIYFELKNFAQSLTTFENLIQKQSPLSHRAKFEKLRVLLEKKDYEASLSLFNQIENHVNKDENFFKVIYQLAHNVKNIEDRRLYSEKYLKAAADKKYLKSHVGNIYTNLANIEKEKGGINNAKEILEKALKQPIGPASKRTILCYLKPLERLNSVAPQLQINNWLNTEPISSKEMDGKIIVIDFWSPGCVPCRELFPRLLDFFNQYKNRGLIIIGITRSSGHYSDDRHHKLRVSREQELKLIKKFLTRHEISIPVGVVKDKKLFNDFGVLGFPTLFVINSRGIITDFKLGANNFNKFEQKIIELIEK